MLNCHLFIKYTENEWSTGAFICNNTNVLYLSQVTSVEQKHISYKMNNTIYSVSWSAKSTILANSQGKQ